MKLDILAFGAHPDDVELSAAGTLITHLRKGYKCGLIDLTRGELGTRGNAETRDAESKNAAAIIGINIRENLKMQDGFFLNDQANQLMIVSAIRKYKPEIILSNAVSDRHPDHARASALISNSVFLAGLLKVKSGESGEQASWKVKAHYHYIQDRYLKPDLVVDITDVWEQKMKAVMAFETQFYRRESQEPETAISGEDFLHFLQGRAMEMGRQAGFKYAEGFTTNRLPGVKDLFHLS